VKKIHVYTSAACNYIPKVRVLVESVRKYHPEWVIHLALSDDVPDGLDLSSEPFDEIHPIGSLGIPDYVGWSFCHNIVELSTAIKPFVLARLLARDDCAGVIYLDPDTVVFSPLTEIVEALSIHNIALTPHQVSPETSLEAIMDNEIASLKHGIYNLGFVAVAPTEIGKQFAAWWSERIYHFCRAEIHNGLFTDQRWIDLVPAFFEGVHILRSSRFNVAPWNISTRKIEGRLSGKITVDGQPLGFYHFTGFDSGAHKTMAWKNGADQHAVHELIDWYTAKIADFGKDPLCAVPWAYGVFDDGSKIPKAARLIYRERVDLQKVFADPFSTLNGGYKAWWQSQGVIEYPGLFTDATADLEMFRITKALSPGFKAGIVNLDPNFFRSHIGRVVSDPNYSLHLIKRTWQIMKTEGAVGLVKRFTH
jgi:hypothetical protein